MYLKKMFFLSAFLLCIILTLFVFRNSNNNLTSSEPLSLTWQTYIPTTQLLGYLYTYTSKNSVFLLSTDAEIHTSGSSTVNDSLQYVTTSGFFNPNAFSKMPNAFWKNYVLFRSYGTTTNPKDLFYAYSMDNNTISESYPPFSILGDIYSENDTLYFFFYIEKELYLAYSTTSIESFLVQKLDQKFDTEKMRFYVGEPAFSYQASILEKYVFDLSKKHFIKNKNYKKPLRVKSEGDNLIFLFPGSNYTFNDTKRFESRTQELLHAGVPLYTYIGNGNIYPIGLNTTN